LSNLIAGCALLVVFLECFNAEIVVGQALAATVLGLPFSLAHLRKSLMQRRAAGLRPGSHENCP
jgi:hypothetical protein